ncbi:MAG: peptidase modulator of gyrase [Ignavibacteria bacterium]|nr:peptidase modulator of gyrase [Ignavibacteria bacterium]
MMKYRIRIIFLILLLTVNANAKESVVLKAAEAELTRAMSELKNQPTPPYFLAYGITETHKVTITASFGKLKTNVTKRERVLDVNVRVGSYDFDNTHIIRGARFNFGGKMGADPLPIEDDELSIRNVIWSATDRDYKDALEKFDKAKTNKAVKVREEDSSADFTHEEPVQKIIDANPVNVDVDYWIKRIESLSAAFSNKNWLLVGMVSFNAEIVTKYYISSEGTRLQWTEPTFRIFSSAKTKADDGMSLPLYKSYFGFEPNSLPDDATITNDINKMVVLLDNMRNAPLMNTYSGPAILSGEAAGVFFHEIFGHRVEGHRQKDPNSSQTFKNEVGKKILPDFIDVIFDPTVKTRNGREVSGYYLFDDEGINAQKVACVEKGIFGNFLMSRSPIENFSKSNGHGRRQAGYEACSRQSNLMVIPRETVSYSKLRDMLKEKCKEQNKEFGLMFDVVQGGFTFTGRTIPNAFNVNPLVVYKIFADGRPDELVRGVDLIGTPLSTFANIIAASDDLGIFNGVCGAESGGVPVSASSPSLLVSTIEVQKKAKSQAKPPVLTQP